MSKTIFPLFVKDFQKRAELRRRNFDLSHMAKWPDWRIEAELNYLKSTNKDPQSLAGWMEYRLKNSNNYNGLSVIKKDD